jgi:hypothetical protein
MTYLFRGLRVREDMIEAIRRYVDDRLQPGSFLTAVICNDLNEAVSRADDDNFRNLGAIVAYFYNETPGGCWGSKAKMQQWLNPEDNTQ